MANRTLVAYATRYGSTQEVAEAFGKTLSECGLNVDVKPMRQLRTLTDYGALVLGAPLCMYHWHKDALRFLARQHRALAGQAGSGVPVAIFAGGPIGDGKAEWEMARGQLSADLIQFPWLKPVDMKIVGGRFDPDKIGFPLRLFTKQVPASDLRDWDDIRRWASALAGLFGAQVEVVTKTA